MSDEEIVAYGLKAAALLDNTDLMWFFRDELERIKISTFNTTPDEGKVRDSLYQRHNALVEFLNSLVAYKDAATNLMESDD